jgi:hypothetical protein
MGCNMSKIKHGHCIGGNNRTYKSWQGMIDRCTNPNNPHYDRYGGRGISICDFWQGDNGFIHFLSEMGERPAGLTLDRIDVNLGYCKTNCRWASTKEQGWNKANTRYITYKGERIALAQLAFEHGLYVSLLERRLFKGWDIEKALSEPIKRNIKYTYNGQEYTIHELAQWAVVSEKRLDRRLLTGWTLEDAMFRPPKKWKQ